MSATRVTGWEHGVLSANDLLQGKTNLDRLSICTLYKIIRQQSLDCRVFPYPVHIDR